MLHHHRGRCHQRELIAQAAVSGAGGTGLFFVELPSKQIAGVGIVPTACVDDVQGIKTEIHLAQSSQ